jgi:hypothetical protein
MVLSAVSKLRSSLAARGFANTVRLAARWGIWKLAPHTTNRVERWLRNRDDARFDRKFGTDTASRRGGPMPDVADSENPGFQYESTTTGAVRLIVRSLNVRAGDWTLVDIGSGKGRVLLNAAEHGFRRIIGVEHSNTLAAIAEDNIRRYRATRTSKADITIIRGDAVQFELPPGPVVIWLYNPFGDELMGRFVQSLTKQLIRDPRRMKIAYGNPLYAAHFDDSPLFRRVGQIETMLQGTCLLFEAIVPHP